MVTCLMFGSSASATEAVRLASFFEVCVLADTMAGSCGLQSERDVHGAFDTQPANDTEAAFETPQKKARFGEVLVRDGRVDGDDEPSDAEDEHRGESGGCTPPRRDGAEMDAEGGRWTRTMLSVEDAPRLSAVL